MGHVASSRPDDGPSASQVMRLLAVLTDNVHDEDIADDLAKHALSGFEQGLPQHVHVCRAGESAVEPTGIGMVKHDLKERIAQFRFLRIDRFCRAGFDLETNRQDHQRLHFGGLDDRNDELVVQLYIFLGGFTLVTAVTSSSMTGRSLFCRCLFMFGRLAVRATGIDDDFATVSRAQVKARPYPTAKTDEGKKDRK